jgi:uncharacterized membrane protein YphA (DoxX/SURF4 family)
MKKYLTTKNLGRFFILLSSLMMIISGTQKVLGTEEMVNNFKFINLTSYLTIVGFMEIIGGILLFYRKTTVYGAILITTIMSAASVIHLSYMGGSGVLTPVLIGVLSWIGYYLADIYQEPKKDYVIEEKLEYTV